MAGANRYAERLTLGRRGQEVEREDHDDEGVGQERQHLEADADHAAEDRGPEVLAGDELLDLVDDVVAVVELLDLPVGLQLPGTSSGALSTISATWSAITGTSATTNRVTAPRNTSDHGEHRRGCVAAPVAHPLHGRVEADGQEHRHHDQDQDRPDREQQPAEPPGQQRPRRGEQPDAEAAVPLVSSGRCAAALGGRVDGRAYQRAGSG